MSTHKTTAGPRVSLRKLKRELAAERKTIEEMLADSNEKAAYFINKSVKEMIVDRIGMEEVESRRQELCTALETLVQENQCGKLTAKLTQLISLALPVADLSNPQWKEALTNYTGLVHLLTQLTRTSNNYIIILKSE